MPIRLSATLLMLLACAGTASAQRTAEQLWEELKRTYPHNRVYDPALELREFIVHPDFEVSLFASSPWVINPVAMAWDLHNRLWVVNAPSYPHILPGQGYTDFVSVLEDTHGVGRADKCTVFYDQLYVPTGIELGDGGAYVANQPDLLFLQSTKGDLHADKRRVLLSGFGTEDDHHAINAFRWGPGGWLYFMSGVFLHSQVETPHGLVRLVDGGTFQFRPRTMKLDLYNVGSATNPWGLAFDRWGQPFLTEGPQGGIWYLTPGTVSSHPGERVPGTEAPKACGNEFLSGRHFGPDYEGVMALNAFKNKTVNLYRFSDDGAGFATRELQPPLVMSKEPFFRPVDVKLGPDGALYVADFFQEIIGHMQYEFRDPRRDHLNGRIWRITRKGGKPLVRPRLAELPLDQLVEELRSPEAFTRDKTRRVLYERSARDLPGVKGALARFVARLDLAGPDVDHLRLEALWAYETVDAIEPELLRTVLRCREPRARAAAVAVLRDWLGHMPDALDLLAERVDDPYARVRLEAVCTLSYFPLPRAMELSARVVDRPIDPCLDYALRHTAVALKAVWLPALLAGRIDFGGRPERALAALGALRSAEAVPLLLHMLKAGRVAPERREEMLILIASLGRPAELAEVFDPARLASILRAPGSEAAGQPAACDPHVHVRVLDALARAARERHVRPSGDLTRLGLLIDSADDGLRMAALRLAGVWQIEALRPPITHCALAERPEAVMRAAVEALADLGGPASVELLERLDVPGKPKVVRLNAVAGLARLDVSAAARRLARLLADDPGADDPALTLEAVLSRKGGAEVLMRELARQTPHADAARLALRHLNASGRAQPALADLLERAAGTGALAKLLAGEDLRRLTADVRIRGDPARGEAVFRRKDLACMSCHAIAGGGPQVGPDLEGLGASSPLDYLVESVLLPNKAVKEGYAAVKIATTAGRVYHGILVRKTEQEVVIRDAASRQIVRLTIAEVDEMADAPTIMPEGLVNAMTRTEFLDLVRFISELGRPGAYATPNIPLARTWRMLKPVPADLAGPLPPEAGRRLMSDGGLTWQPAYSAVSGELPAADLGSGPVAFVQTRFEVGTPGKVLLRLNSALGLTLWIDGESMPLAEQTEVDLRRGMRVLTFRVDRSRRQDRGLRLLLDEAPGSVARAQVIKGP